MPFNTSMDVIAIFVFALAAASVGASIGLAIGICMNSIRKWGLKLAQPLAFAGFGTGILLQSCRLLTQSLRNMKNLRRAAEANRAFLDESWQHSAYLLVGALAVITGALLFRWLYRWFSVRTVEAPR